MALLSAQDEEVLSNRLAAIVKPVTLLLFTQTIGGSESGAIAKQVLGEVARLSDKVAVHDKNFILDAEERTAYAVDKSPAIVILADGKDTRMRLFGAPTGYEFVPLIEAVLLAGTGRIELQDDTLDALARVDTPTHFQVFTTPT